MARVVADGGDEQRVHALSLVTAAYGIHGEPCHAAGVESVTALMREEHIVLSLLRRYAGGYLPETFSRRVDGLDAVLGQAASEPAPLFWINSSWERDEDSVPADLDDSEWLAEVAAWPDFDTDEDRAYALKKAARAAAERDPARFARLLTDFPNSAPATGVIAVLEGISAALQARPESEEIRRGTMVARIYDAIRNAFGRPHDPDLDIAIARCIHHLAGQPDLPEDIVLLPTQICDVGRNPIGGEVWHDHLVGSAHSQPRGVALNTVAALLAQPATRSERLPLFKPLLEQVTTDLSEAVRVLVPQALVLTWSEAPEFVITLAREWLASAPPRVLEAPRLPELMWLMRNRSPASTAAFLRAMASSPSTHARTAAAWMATMLAVDNVELPGFDRPLLELFLADTDVRAAVADCLTQLVSSLPPSDPGEPEASPTLGLLLRLMNDEAGEVREQTTAVVRYMEGPLSTYADLLKAIRDTRMFSETPAYVLDGLHRRLGELPDIVVALCEDWLQRWSAESGDISTHAAAEAYEVTDIVLATYHATSSEAMIDRCLDILDRLIENGAGGANLRADDAA
ncbi:hypothetical protein [Nocardia sp. CA-120079]|uniref:hypothetical protein n=1 Tax=Nocardia sp. CA-120079 TaxID=3239974 RepID=UPI003D99F45D